MLQGKIKSLEQIFLFSLPVKEYQIVESFLQSSLKDEVMKIMPVQKQTRAGQRTRFKVLLTSVQSLHVCLLDSADIIAQASINRYVRCQTKMLIRVLTSAVQALPYLPGWVLQTRKTGRLMAMSNDDVHHDDLWVCQERLQLHTCFVPGIWALRWVLLSLRSP